MPCCDRVKVLFSIIIYENSFSYNIFSQHRFLNPIIELSEILYLGLITAGLEFLKVYENFSERLLLFCNYLSLQLHLVNIK